MIPDLSKERQDEKIIRRPSLQKTSEFEQHVSGKIEITDEQLAILRRHGGVAFSHDSPSSPADSVRVPVLVVKRSDDGSKPLVVVDAGYLTGTREAIEKAFRMLGIESPFAVSTDIRQFGYDLFRQPPSTFAPVDRVPVGPDYVFGPGDEMRLTIWGRVEGEWNIVVDRDGNITLPRIGTIGVAGLTFRELKDVLDKEFSKYYNGFQMNVSMGSLRSIRVYVVGSAERPGAYTVSSLSTLMNALFEAGGPSKTGTMRGIQVKRGGETVVSLDMYDFLLNGDKTKDARLMPEDVVYIPPVGPLVGIAGSVNRPAIYELKGEETVSDLIAMAGGLSDVAFRGRVQIERIVENTRQTVFESDLPGVADMKLAAGDVVKIFPIVEDRRMVRISGSVQREGQYGFKPGMTVRDLISMAGGLKYYAYSKEAELTRVRVTADGPETEKIKVELDKAMAENPGNTFFLAENDYLFVRAVPEWKLYQTVTVSGEVRFPGTYTIRKGERLSSLIERAGGFTEGAYLRGAVFTRVRVRELQQSRLEEMVERIETDLLGSGSAKVSTASSTEEAEIRAAELKQKEQFVEKLKTVRAKGRMVLRVDEPERLKGTVYDIELEDGDGLNVPANPRSIQVVGSVFNQTAFVYDSGKDYSDYIELAGGYTGNADRKDAYILKADGTATRKSSDLDPGDTIVVPEKLEKVAWMRETKDMTQILYQIAVTAGVLLLAF